jgi:2-polyprenyl-3-methyl-5-hydroxy-6-metoxy-1,4-benzoquinol methylase
MYYGFLPYIGVPKNILDVGCGCGHSTVCLSNIFGNSDIVGIDISSNSINFAKEHNSNDNVKYLNSNFLDIKLDSKFNCIFSLEILEHIKADLHFGFIDKCLSLLSNDGLLCISTPNAIDEKDEPNGHIGLVNSDRALKLISRYRKNIVYSAFYDNKKLLSLNPDVYTVNGDIDNFNKDTDTKSHFKIIMKA